MSKKNWKRLLIITGSVFLLLVVTLFVHIMIVTSNKGDKQDLRSRQLSIISLTEKVDSEKGSEITKMVLKMKGVREAKFNKPGMSIIYEIDPQLQSPDAVVAALDKQGYPVKKFVIAKKGNAESCPVMDKSSISYRMGKFFQDILN